MLQHSVQIPALRKVNHSPDLIGVPLSAPTVHSRLCESSGLSEESSPESQHTLKLLPVSLQPFCDLIPD